MIIAIDGTSGSGKSTIAKQLAKQLNFGFFSAGDLYRAITVRVLDLGIDENEDEKLKNLVENIKISYVYDGTKNILRVDNIDVSNKLHTEEVSNFVSKISHKLFIREVVRKFQRQTAVDNENIVMEGRDIGSVIFPNADIKIFVDCKIETRAQRRLIDYQKIGENVSLEKVIDDLKKRDYRDIHREISPLVISEDSFLLDTTLNSVQTSLTLIYEEMIRRNLITYEFLKERGINLL